jgi:hypothetical protein
VHDPARLENFVLAVGVGVVVWVGVGVVVVVVVVVVVGVAVVVAVGVGVVTRRARIALLALGYILVWQVTGTLLATAWGAEGRWTATADSTRITAYLSGRTESGRSLGWHDTQSAARMACYRCTRPSDWTGEESRRWAATAAHDQFLSEPLGGFTFIGLEMAGSGSWGSDADRMLLVLADGTTLQSIRPEPHPSARAPAYCDLLLPQFGAQYFTVDHPATFMVVFDTRERSIRPRDIRAVEVHFNEAWTELAPESR